VIWGAAAVGMGVYPLLKGKKIIARIRREAILASFPGNINSC
jgi:hypothetical protein